MVQQGETETRSAPAADGSRRIMRSVGRTGLFLCAAAGLALAGGFAWFIGRVPDQEIRLSSNADGIVALAGGASRISDAIELLAWGRGRRLLISGVNRTTSTNA